MPDRDRRFKQVQCATCGRLRSQLFGARGKCLRCRIAASISPPMAYRAEDRDYQLNLAREINRTLAACAEMAGGPLDSESVEWLGLREMAPHVIGGLREGYDELKREHVELELERDKLEAEASAQSDRATKLLEALADIRDGLPQDIEPKWRQVARDAVEDYLTDSYPDYGNELLP